jgi:hypothetical protein
MILTCFYPFKSSSQLKDEKGSGKNSQRDLVPFFSGGGREEKSATIDELSKPVRQLQLQST